MNSTTSYRETPEESVALAKKLADWKSKHPETKEVKEVKTMLATAPNFLAALDGINEINARNNVVGQSV